MATTNTKDVSFATLNLKNLQLPGKSMYSQTYTHDAYQAKIQWTASLVSKLDADVIAFQELWSKECLEQVFQEDQLAGSYELFFIGESWYNTAVAAAVRAPWKGRVAFVHKSFPEEFRLIKRGGSQDDEDDDIEVKIDKFSRSVLQLAVTHTLHDLPTIMVFAAHLKSKLPTQLDSIERADEDIRKHSAALGAAVSTIRRTAEAAALRIILDKEMKNSDVPTVALGDMNDSQLSNTLAILTAQPSYRLYESSAAGWKSDAGLYSALTMQEYRSLGSVYYTHIYKGVRETLDHVLVSEQFYDHSKKRVWSFREMRVWNDHVDAHTNEWEDSAECKSSSDHGVVRAGFVYDRA